MEEKITIPLSEGEWNVIIHALAYKTQDRLNSDKANKQYRELFKKLTNIRHGDQ